MIVRAPENTTHIFNLMRAIFSLLRFCYFKDNFYYTTSTQITNITNYKMAIRNSHKESASESESNTNTHTRHTAGSSSNSKISQKARNQLAFQQQQQYLAKHINSNGPQDKPKLQPLDFTTYSDTALLKYSERYGFHNFSRIDSLNSDILNSEIGKKTYSKRSKRIKRIQVGLAS